MNSPEITSAVLAEHRHDLRHEARRSALAAIARCCSPTAWRSAARRFTSSLPRSAHAESCAC